MKNPKPAGYVRHPVVCPVCGKERDARQTVLWDWYRTYYRPGFVATASHPLPKDFTQVVQTFVERFRPDADDRRIHTLQWACHVCIHEGRVIDADYDKQLFGLGGPILAYTDLPRTCQRCGKPFVFTAAEQQHWYEELGFIVDSMPNEDPACRALLRREKQLRQRLGELSKVSKPTVEELQELHGIYTELGLAEKAETVQRRLKNKTRQTDF